MFMYLNCSKPYYSTLIMIMKVQIYLHILWNHKFIYHTAVFPLFSSTSFSFPPPILLLPPPPLLLPFLLIPILTLLPLLPRRCVVCELITVAMAALRGMSLSSAVRSLLVTIIWRYVFIGATCMCPLVLHISWVYTGGGGGGSLGSNNPPSYPQSEIAFIIESNQFY